VKSGDGAEKGRLAASARTEEKEQLARRDIEIEIIDRNNVFKASHEPANVDGYHCCRKVGEKRRKGKGFLVPDRESWRRLTGVGKYAGEQRGMEVAEKIKVGRSVVDTTVLPFGFTKLESHQPCAFAPLREYSSVDLSRQ